MRVLQSVCLASYCLWVYRCENVLDWNDVHIFFCWILEESTGTMQMELAQSLQSHMLATTGHVTKPTIASGCSSSAGWDTFSSLNVSDAE